MTAPSELPVSIEHLDHRPECEGRRHKGGPAVPATFWVDMHGCFDKFSCAACLDNDRRWFAMVGGSKCRICRAFFATAAEAMTVVPL